MGKGRLQFIRFILAGPPEHPEALRSWQDRQLRRLLQHAYATVPFYRRLWSSRGLGPDSLRRFADFHRLPLVDKDQLRAAQPEERVSRRRPWLKPRLRSTSGTSGAPLVVCISWLEDRLLALHRLAAVMRMGWRPPGRYARVRMVAPGYELPWFLACLDRRGLSPLLSIDCAQPTEEILERLERLNPEVVGAYPIVLERLAAEALRRNRKIHPKFVCVGGAQLDARARRTISCGFAAPIREFYGCHEANLVALQCPESPLLHAAEEVTLVEIVDEEGQPVDPGATGEIVITALHSFYQPYIRYRLGDRAERGPEVCPCGWRGLTIARVEGRIGEWIPLPDGDSVLLDSVTAPVFRESEWVDRFQLFLARPDLLELRVVASRKPLSQEIRRLEAAMHRALRAQVTVRVILADELELEPSGKYRKLQVAQELTEYAHRRPQVEA